MQKRVALLLTVVLLVLGLSVGSASADSSVEQVATAKARVNALSAEFQGTETQKQNVEAQIAQIDQALPALEQKTAVLRARVVKRAVAVYMDSGSNSLALLLDADYRTFKRELAQELHLANRDARLIKSYQDQAAALRSQQGALSAKRDDLVDADHKEIRLQAVLYANEEVGKPYQYASRGPDSFDCSGLVSFVFGRAGISLTAYSGAQYDETARVSKDQLEMGDLVFYGAGGSSHVAIYVGGDVMIAAPHTGDVVKYQEVYGSPSGYGRVI